MARKEVKESHNQTDVRYIRRHPKHDRFPVRRLGLAAVLIARCHDPYGRSAVAVAHDPLARRNPTLALPMQRSLGVNVARPVLSVCCLVNKKVVTEGSSIARMPERHGGWSEFS